MKAFLREGEANQLVLLLVVLGFLLILFAVGLVATRWFGADWSAILGIGGMGTGAHVSTATNQALQARNPNYTPMIANPNVTPLPPTPPAIP